MRGSTSCTQSTLAEFFILLAWDKELILGSYSESDEYIEPTEGNQLFRMWMREQHHLETAPNPRDVIQKAKRNHPDLQEWIESKQ